MADHILGLDLGRMSDSSALSIVKRTLKLGPNGVLPARDHRGRTLYRFNVRQAKRYKLHTPYPDIITHIKDRVLSNPKYGSKPRLVVDATGVGGAVIDMLLTAKLSAIIIPLTITGGDAVRKDGWPGASRTLAYWVAKGQLCSAIQAALQDERLKISDIPHEKGMPDPGEILKKEMLGFSVKVSKAANELYSHREGEHDDLLLATAMAVFIGGRPEIHYGSTARDDGDVATLDVEQKTEAEAQEKQKKQDAEAEFQRRQELDRKRQQDPGDPTWRWNIL